MSDQTVRGLADELADRVLAADPMLGTELGLREYDAGMPDNSVEGEQEHLGELADIARRAAALEPADAAERITLGVIAETCASRRLAVETAPDDHTVTAQPIAGPPSLLAVTAVTAPVDARAAADYLLRLRASVGWIDTGTARLRDGAARGRTPVRALLDQALEWCDRTLSEQVPAALLPPAPAGWDGASAWQDEVREVVRTGVAPAVARWRDALVELRPLARPDARAGLAALPGGEADYERAIRVHTTLPLTADELHRTGLAAISELEERARELGARLGLAALPEVRAAVRESGAVTDPERALTAVREAIRRAEERAPELMPQPLPEPCTVKAMPLTVAASGMAPHYSPPKRDGSRPGTYWFNTVRPSAGAGWDLEAVAYHETVPGHHSQLGRQQRLAGLPLVQQLIVTAHAEGWGLYAERLAGEFGLYSDVRCELGAVATELFRAARLVVDTGLHAFGWERERAVAFMVEHVPLPPAFLADEVARYVAWPGQALAYLTGQREILRLREQARGQLGAAFDLPGFNAAVLDSGSLPLPVLGDAVRAWVETRRGGPAG